MRLQKVCDLIGPPRQHGKRQLGLAVAVGIDDPERRTVLALADRMPNSASNESSAQSNGTASGQRKSATASS